MSEDLRPPPRTSLNAIKHGGRSQQILLPHEDPAKWKETRDLYLEEFNPQTSYMRRLVDDAAAADWIFQRNQTNLHVVQFDMPADPRDWTPEHHHQIALYTRYQTAAERSFSRALTRLHGHHKIQKKNELATISKPPNKVVPKDPVVIEQWVEVRTIDDEVVTQFYPSNEELEEMINDEEPKPELVYRRICFPDGVPALYQWAMPRKGPAPIGGMAIQRMTVETWFGLRDKERETGHVCSAGPSLRDWRDQEAS